MIFGEKYFEMLKKLSPWRQSLFALVLAQRQYPNYKLWCEINHLQSYAEAFDLTLKQLWLFHQDKFNHIDLESLLDYFEPFAPKEQGEPAQGDLFALDACISLNAASLAIVLHEGEEAEMASKSSLGGVVRAVETSFDHYPSDEELRDNVQVDAEVNFQVDLMMRLQKSKRSLALTLELMDLGINGGVSNIGILLEGLNKQNYTA